MKRFEDIIWDLVELEPDPPSARIRSAGKFGVWFLDQFGFAAITSPWKTIYIKPEYLGLDWLIRHEVAHLAQMQRDGWLYFWTHCIWWYFSPGYYASPYEIEARACEENANHPLLKGWHAHRD